MIHVFLTFDYELFFGKNYLGPDEILFDPTFKLLELAREKDVPLVFFSDVLSIKAGQDIPAWEAKYCRPFKEQLLQCVHLEHEVQLHLHPHWQDAIWDGTDWSFPLEHMLLANVIEGQGESAAKELFVWGDKYLRNTLGATPNAFRAGGWGVQPYDTFIIRTLLDLKYEFDSSVVPYAVHLSKFIRTDFSRCDGRNVWEVSEHGGFTEHSPNHRSLIEMPLLSISNLEELSLLEKLQYRRLHYANRIREKVFGKSYDPHWYLSRGQGANLSTPGEKYQGTWRINFDASSVRDLERMLLLFDHYIRKYSENKNTYVTLIGHPKTMNEEALECLGRFIDGLRQRYGPQVCFSRFNDLDSDEIKLEINNGTWAKTERFQNQNSHLE